MNITREEKKMNTKKEKDIYCSDGANRLSVGDTTESRFERRFDSSRAECPWERETSDALMALKKMLHDATPSVWVGR
jgi:hypothetical protein